MPTDSSRTWSPTVRASILLVTVMIVVSVGLALAVAAGPDARRAPVTVPVEDPYEQPVESSDTPTGVILHNSTLPG